MCDSRVFPHQFAPKTLLGTALLQMTWRFGQQFGKIANQQSFFVLTNA
jgi:hypothetical protein